MKPGQASATALLVAASVARRGNAHGLPAAAIEIARRALSQGPGWWPLVSRLSRRRPGRVVLDAIEAAILPGLADHHCARKAWLWQRLREHSDAASRVVWLGSGFDGLGRALRSYRRDIHITETDHPDTLHLRRGVVESEAGVDVLAVQLPQDQAALAALCGDGPSTLVAEGVLMYLAPRTVLRLFRSLSALPTPPRLLFTALDAAQPGRRGFHRMSEAAQGWLIRRGEPFRWRASPRRLARVLADAGYAVQSQWHGGGFGEFAMDAVPV
jgi:O-methyltransferase involved in polyketide biosynthesis